MGKPWFSYVLLTVSLLACGLLIGLYTHFRYAILFMLGSVLGLALIVGHIGFTGAWRSAILKRDARPLAHMYVLLALASVASMAVLAAEPLAIPNKAPLSLSLVVGAFLFGIGMQCGRGCGSGTAVHAARGSEYSLVTLLFFIVGSVVGSMHLPVWLSFAVLDPVYLPDILDWRLVAVGYSAIFAVLFIALAKRSGTSVGVLLWQKRRLVGGGVLVATAMLVLVFSGTMWSVTFAYTLWGAKLAQFVGIDITAWEFWQWDLPATALSQSALANVTSLTTLGMLAGAFFYALWSKGFAGNVSMRLPQMFGAMIGGLLMGYGARLSFGCNIGALFSGLASGSLHGWVWFACAYLGSWVALTRLPVLCGVKQTLTDSVVGAPSSKWTQHG